jgi:hypothetical protein
MARGLDRRISRLEAGSPLSGLSDLTDAQLDGLMRAAREQANAPLGRWSWRPFADALGCSEERTAAFVWETAR